MKRLFRRGLRGLTRILKIHASLVETWRAASRNIQYETVDSQHIQYRPYTETEHAPSLLGLPFIAGVVVIN